MISSFVGSVKTRLAVDNATTSSDDPTPIYVLDELVQTLGSGDVRAAVDAVCARLGHSSPVVKQKALKLVAHIGRKGSAELRRAMARQSAAVRALLHFRCEPDPFKGDTVWKRVQEYAQEALNAIHSEPAAVAAAQPGMAAQQGVLGGRIQGFGSEASGSSGMMAFGGGGGGSSGRGLTGFGSSDVFASGMQALSSGVRSLSGGLGRQQGGLLQQEGYSSAQLDGSGNAGSSYAGSSSRPPASGGGSGGSGSSQPVMAANSGAPFGGMRAGAAVAHSGGQQGSGGGGGGAEQRLVDRICTPGGLRAAPSREDTRAFVDGLTSLDGEAVAQLLQRKLEAGPWQAALRALCAIEAVVEGGSSAAAGQVAVHFQAHPEAVRRAAASPQATLRQRAQQVLALLGDPTAAGGGGGAANGGGSTQQQQQQQQLFTEDILLDTEPSGGSSSTAAPAGAAAAGLADLLGDTGGSPAAAAPQTGPAAAAAATAAEDLLAGLEVPAAAAAARQQQQPVAAAAGGGGSAAHGDDLFGSMMLGNTQQALGGPAGPSQPAAAAGGTSMDLLAGLTLESTNPAAASSSRGAAAAHLGAGSLGDALSGLSLGGPAPSALASGDAFPLQPLQQQQWQPQPQGMLGGMQQQQPQGMLGGMQQPAFAGGSMLPQQQQQQQQRMVGSMPGWQQPIYPASMQQQQLSQQQVGFSGGMHALGMPAHPPHGPASGMALPQQMLGAADGMPGWQQPHVVGNGAGATMGSSSIGGPHLGSYMGGGGGRHISGHAGVASQMGAGHMLSGGAHMGGGNSSLLSSGSGPPPALPTRKDAAFDFVGDTLQALRKK